MPQTHNLQAKLTEGILDAVGNALKVSGQAGTTERGQLLHWGTTVPTDNTAGYPHGALFFKLNGTGATDAVYCNIGTKLLCNFDILQLNIGSLTDAHIYVGNAANLATDVAMTGDVTIDNTGLTAIGAKKVTAGMTAIAEGNLLVGDAGGAGSAVSFKTDGRIPIGDGTTVNSVAVGGDVTINNAGSVAIGAKKVLDTMIALANTKILVGDAGGAAAAQTMAGDATLAANGDLTIAAKAVTAAKTAITEGSILVGDAAGAGAELVAKTDTRILVGNGTTLVSVPVSGDATLANTGAVTALLSRDLGVQAAAAAIAGTASGSAYVQVAGAGEVGSVDAPTAVGRIISVTCDTLGGGGDRTYTCAADLDASGNDKFQFTAAGQNIVLLAVRIGGVPVFRLLQNNGCTLS